MLFVLFFFVCRGNVHHTLHGSSVGNQLALLLALIFLYGSSVGNQPALLLAFIFFFHGSFVGFQLTLLINSCLCSSPWCTANLPFFIFHFPFFRLLTAYTFRDQFCCAVTAFLPNGRYFRRPS